MTAYLSFEWLKIEKRWMPRVILLLLLGLLAIFFWGQGSRLENQANMFFPRAWLAALYGASFCAPFFWPVLGGSWPGNEYGWGTIRLALTRRPSRIQHVLAALAVLVVGLAIALVAVLALGTAAGVIVGLTTGHGAVISGVLSASFIATAAKTFLAAWFIAAFYLILAYTTGVIFRSAPVGIGIGLGSTLAQFALIPIFRSLGGVWNTVAQHFPIMYAEDLVQNVAASGFAHGTSLAVVSPSDPSISSSILALGFFMVGLVAAMLITVKTRDVVD
jgi:hypothetical protein